MKTDAKFSSLLQLHIQEHVMETLDLREESRSQIILNSTSNPKLFRSSIF